MSVLSQSSITTPEKKHLGEAEKTSFMTQSLLEIISKEAVFQRREGAMKTKPSIFDNPNILPRLAMAFSIGGSVEEAAHFAGCSVSVIKKHMRERTPFQVTTPWGESCTVTFDEMVSGWQCHITLLAKLAIYKSIYSSDLKLAAKNAWKILERREPDKWGGTCRQCLRQGVKVY